MRAAAEAFVEDGGWKFLMDDDEVEADGSEEGEDSQEEDDPGQEEQRLAQVEGHQV